MILRLQLMIFVVEQSETGIGVRKSTNVLSQKLDVVVVGYFDVSFGLYDITEI